MRMRMLLTPLARNASNGRLAATARPTLSQSCVTVQAGGTEYFFTSFLYRSREACLGILQVRTRNTVDARTLRLRTRPCLLCSSACS